MNQPGQTIEAEGRGVFRWEFLVLLMAGLLLFLGFQLFRRLQNVDPLQRCVGAYENVHTAVDTSLVDRMRVRTPDRREHTTCGQLRRSGALQNVTRPPGGGGLLPPRPS